MDSYLALLIVGGISAAAGAAANAGIFSLNFGSHNKLEHPEAVWRTANSRAGLGIMGYGILIAVGALVARSDTPHLDDAFGAIATVGLILPIIGVRSAMRLLKQSTREQRNPRPPKPR